MYTGFNLKSPAALAPNKGLTVLRSIEARHWLLLSGYEVIDGIFFQYETLLSALEIWCLG